MVGTTACMASAVSSTASTGHWLGGLSQLLPFEPQALHFTPSGQLVVVAEMHLGKVDYLMFNFT